MQTTRGGTGFVVLPQQTPLAQMGPYESMPVFIQAYARYAMGPSQVSSSLSELSFLLIFCVCVVFALHVQVPMWSQCTPIGAEPFGFSNVQPLTIYPWQVYVPPGAVSCPQSFNQYGMVYSFGDSLVT